MKFATSKKKEKRSSAPQKRKEKKKFTTSKKRKKKKSSASKKERKEEVDHLKLLFDVARHIAFPLQLSLSLVDHCRQFLRDCDDWFLSACQCFNKYIKEEMNWHKYCFPWLIFVAGRNLVFLHVGSKSFGQFDLLLWSVFCYILTNLPAENRVSFFTRPKLVWSFASCFIYNVFVHGMIKIWWELFAL